MKTKPRYVISGCLCSVVVFVPLSVYITNIETTKTLLINRQESEIGLIVTNESWV